VKPYAVSITIGDKVTGKEFDTESEFRAFLLKVTELKKKAPQLVVKILRNGIKPKPVVKSQLPSVSLDEGKEECMAWKRVIKDGVPMVDPDGKQVYKAVPVPSKPKVFYCPYCHGYKYWGMVDLDYDLKVKGCVDCGMTINDFNIKTVNGLWNMKVG
jgi:hypothetical protein